VVLRDGVTTPQAVGIIHCVGSRDRNYNRYCSSICCMQSLKFAHLVKERTGARVYNFYNDIRTPAKAYDEFYQHVLEENIIFVRGKVAEVTDAARLPGEEGKLIVQVEDTLVGKQRRIPLDMVVLSAGLEPRADSKEVAKKFGISCSYEGWFIERHPKLDPIATMTDGIFIAGACQGRKTSPPAVSRGAAAAARTGPGQPGSDQPGTDSVLMSTPISVPAAASATPCARSTPSPGRSEHQRDQPGAVPGLRRASPLARQGDHGSHFSNEQIWPRSRVLMDLRAGSVKA
jgi:hypothetical protein